MANSGTSTSMFGETYEYANQIKSPDLMKMSDYGSWNQIKKNVNGLESYFTVLLEGGGNASKVKSSALNGGLGNRYFLKTGQKCSNKKDRYIYIDHVPTKRTSQASVGFGNNVGLIPGITNNAISAIDPIGMASAFMDTSPTKECIEVDLSTVDQHGTSGSSKQWISKDDVTDIDACWFAKKNNVRTNPETKKRCRDGFSNISDTQFTGELSGSELSGSELSGSELSGSELSITRTNVDQSQSSDILESAYILLIGGVGLYALNSLLKITR